MITGKAVLVGGALTLAGVTLWLGLSFDRARVAPIGEVEQGEERALSDAGDSIPGAPASEDPSPNERRELAPEPAAPDPLAKARAFNRLDLGPDGWPVGLRDPDSYNPWDRELTARMQRELGTEEILERVSHADAHTALAARQALKRDRLVHLELIREWLGDPQQGERVPLALKGLRVLGTRGLEAEVRRVAGTAPDPAVRGDALRTLGTDDPRPLQAALADPDWSVRNTALSRAAQVDDPTPELRSAVGALQDDPRPIVRARAHTLFTRWSSAEEAERGAGSPPSSIPNDYTRLEEASR